MRIRQMAMSAAFATGLAALPLATAQAQYYTPYYSPCAANPLAWPFCIAGAIVGTAATIATAPFWLLAGPRPYYGYYPAPSYYAPAYYAPSYASYAPPPAAAPQAALGAPAPLPPASATARRPAGSAQPPTGNAYYFCPTSKAYYPYVATCPVAWRPVPTTPPKS
jgi:hypothetical protein